MAEKFATLGIQKRSYKWEHHMRFLGPSKVRKGLLQVPDDTYKKIEWELFKNENVVYLEMPEYVTYLELIEFPGSLRKEVC